MNFVRFKMMMILIRKDLPQNIRDFLSSLVKFARNNDDDGAVVNSQQEPGNEEPPTRDGLPNLSRVEFCNLVRTAIHICLSLKPDRVKGSIQHQLYTRQHFDS